MFPINYGIQYTNKLRRKLDDGIGKNVSNKKTKALFKRRHSIKRLFVNTMKSCISNFILFLGQEKTSKKEVAYLTRRKRC